MLLMVHMKNDFYQLVLRLITMTNIHGGSYKELSLSGPPLDQ